MSTTPTLLHLRSTWTTLYKTTLPHLAVSKAPSQHHWPVHLDHCFARIILDNAIGVSKPWTEVLAAPAIKNMNATQLGLAIALGEQIARGETGLVELDERSLALRGKTSKSKTVGAKRKNVDDDVRVEANEDEVKAQVRKKIKSSKVDGSISKYFPPCSKPQSVFPGRQSAKATSLPSPSDQSQYERNPHKATASPAQVATFSSPQDPLLLISTSNLTPYRKKVLSLLCAVPRGHWTSYAAISDHIGANGESKTCARAVGNAMRNNPFAPVVPCHRVLAAGGQIGGFGGEWGERGVHATEKRGLLLEEGVAFDEKGRARGVAWRGWEG